MQKIVNDLSYQISSPPLLSRAAAEKKIYKLWYPLLLTWLMMSVEGPIISAFIARMPEETFNLAAYGIAFSFALIFEAPVIMILSLSTVLVKDQESYRKIYRFTQTLNVLVTVLFLLLFIPVVFDGVFSMLNLHEKVYTLLKQSLWILLPWPGAIGIRRFYQGILIKEGQTSLVARGTFLRITVLVGVCLFLYNIDANKGLYFITGVQMGSCALSAGVMSEAIFAFFAARPFVRRTKEAVLKEGTGDLTYKYIYNFYMPLFFSSFIALCSQPIITFFVAYSLYPLESLAVIPVVNALIFIFRCVGLSYQEVVLAIIAEDKKYYPYLKGFALKLGVVFSGLLGVVAATSLVDIWLTDISGLHADLAEFAQLPIKILVVFPCLSILLSWQRSICMTMNITKKVVHGTIVESLLLVMMMFLLGVVYGKIIGATLAALSLLTARSISCLYMHLGSYKKVREFY